MRQSNTARRPVIHRSHPAQCHTARVQGCGSVLMVDVQTEPTAFGPRFGGSDLLVPRTVARMVWQALLPASVPAVMDWAGLTGAPPAPRAEVAARQGITP